MKNLYQKKAAILDEITTTKSLKTASQLYHQLQEVSDDIKEYEREVYREEMDHIARVRRTLRI